MESPLSDEHEESPNDRAGTGLSGRVLLVGAAVAVVGLFLLLGVFSGGADEPSEVEEFAALAFLTEDGQTSTLADFQGEPLVVNFFASWCAPCRAELPDFEKVNVANGDAVRFIGVNHDLDEVTWKAFVEETEITYETVFQPNTEIWTTLDAKAMPTTAFIDADGQLVELWAGVLNAELLQSMIDEHLLAEA